VAAALTLSLGSNAEDKASGGHLGANGIGYAIIRESHIPVLSV
jgi:hypothetical protein